MTAVKKKPGKKKSKKYKWLTRIIVFALVIGGTGFILYPVAGKILSARAQTEVIEDYRLSVSQMNEETIQKEWKKALKYNQDLADVSKKGGNALKDSDLLKEYSQSLNQNNIMGHLEIPSLDIHLPIYHGIANSTLDKGIGHIPNTALPLGGKGEHTTLTGHSGHPSSSLLDKLHKLNIGDTFELFILDKKFTYSVDNMEIVLPGDVSLLQAEPGHCYVTLVTCTPYGINSHRLLVRGELISEEKLFEAARNYISISGEVQKIATETVAVFILIFLLPLYIITSIQKFKNFKKFKKLEKRRET